MNTLRVLIIDDEESSRQVLRATLMEETGWDVQDQGFEGLEETLVRFRPDVVVLDLMDDSPPERTDTGNRSFDQIRETWFCPIVVYSAFPDEQHFDHRLVKTIVKGTDSDVKVRDRLVELVPQAQMIRSVHDDFDARIREALHDSVHAIGEQMGTETNGSADSILARAVRRLVAARVDAGASADATLHAWERWIVPPLGDHLLTADLLRLKQEDWENQEAFRLILTPSCDLATSHDREPKVEKVLVACCEPMKQFGRIQLQMGQRLRPRVQNQLSSILTEGMADNILPIPGFRGHVPLMVANLKRLELIEWSRIDLGVEDDDAEKAHPEFCRVASTDSPFREMVVWAYLRVTGRPGVPNIDVEGWMDDISNYLETGGQRA